MNVPKLRFKDADGREFPEWGLKELREVCKKIIDGTHFSPKSKEGSRRYLTSKNIRNSGIDLLDCNYISEEEHKEIFKKCPVKMGDILLTKDGANTGNCCINSLQEEFSLLSSVAVIDGMDDLVNNIFLLQVFQSQFGINTINNAMAGQAISRITLEKIKKFSFNFPVITEQTKIANFLTAIDEKITQFTQKCDLLAQYKKGVMQQIFSQKLRFKDNDGREFPEWEENELGKVCNPRQWATISSSQLCKTGYPVYGANGQIGYYHEYNHELETVTVTCRGATCGEVNLISPQSYITGNSMCLDDINLQKLDRRFIYFAMKFRGFKDIISGSAQPQIVSSAIRKIKFENAYELFSVFFILYSKINRIMR